MPTKHNKVRDKQALKHVPSEKARADSTKHKMAKEKNGQVAETSSDDAKYQFTLGRRHV